MTPGAHVRTLMSNETRALLPTWIASVLAASVAARTAGQIHDMSLLAFAAATIGLGAQSIGHEYAHRTLGLMLTLPVSRRRLFLVKLAVVGAMVLPLACYAWRLGLFVDVPALLWLIAGAALCLAPPLTMLCRSQLAGTIFSMSVPAMLGQVVMIVTGTPWNSPAEAERAAVAMWSWLMVPVLASGAVLGWLLFMRLEWIEGDMTEVQLRWWTRAPRDVAPGRPLWQLVKKELRLQQMTFAITALYLTTWPAAAMMDDDAAFVGASIYWLGLPLLVGSLAIAQERQLGTLPWQLQLPPPAWQQWAAKVGTVFGLALLLAIGVPVLLVPVLWPTERPAIELTVVLAIVITAASMYISSLCTTGLRAAVASLAAIPLVLWAVVAFAQALSPAPFRPEFWSGREGAWLALLFVVVVLLVGFAFVNHRPEQPGRTRMWRQTVSLAALIGFGIVLLETARF